MSANSLLNSGKERGARNDVLDALEAGQIITLTAGRDVWPDLAAVEFRAQGRLVTEQTTEPFETVFAVPFGVKDLELEIVGKDSTGRGLGRATQTFRVTVPTASPGTLAGRVVDAAGAPLANVPVRFDSPGLTAEYFDSKTPPVALPDLTGRTADRRGAVLALAHPNPGGAFGNDPFGTGGLPPDYAARFRGFLVAPVTGTYRFHVESGKDPAALYLDGAKVTGPLRLTGGQRVEVEVLQAVGVAPPELVLAWSIDGARMQVVNPMWLFHRSAVLTTDERGEFRMEDTNAGLPGGGLIRVVTPGGEGSWVARRGSEQEGSPPMVVVPANGDSKISETGR